VRSSVAKWCESAQGLTGAFALLYYGLVWLDARYAQWNGEQLLSAGVRTGDLVGRITIAKTGMEAVVFEGTDDRTLARGVGHLTGSAFPGEKGNVVLAAHRDTFFRSLEHVKAGDRIELATPSGSLHYRIDQIRIVNPDDLYVVRPTRTPTLTLITCYPFHYIGNAPKRYIVRGVEVQNQQSVKSRLIRQRFLAQRG
jgi:LPXTG-site transpeptidase (sortase) family protein